MKLRVKLDETERSILRMGEIERNYYYKLANELLPFLLKGF